LKLGQKSALVWRAFARKGQDVPGARARAVEDLKAYQSALPKGYATDEVVALLKELGAD